jgi:hypothetical protein
MNTADRLNAAFLKMQDPLREILSTGYGTMTREEIELLEKMLREGTHVIRFLLDTSPMAATIFVAPVDNLAAAVVVFHAGALTPAPEKLN